MTEERESQDPSGAVDHDYDDADRTTEAEQRLRENIADFPSTIRKGDVVIDLIEGRPLYIHERKGTAADVFEREAFDLTTYKTHPFLPISPTDDVFECVFLPTKPADIPSKKKSSTYDYPRGRLARIPVEWLYDSDTHRHADERITALSLLFENAADDKRRQAVVDVAIDTFGVWVDIALEVAGFDPSDYHGSENDSGPVDPEVDREPPVVPEGDREPSDDRDDLGKFDDFDG